MNLSTTPQQQQQQQQFYQNNNSNNNYSLKLSGIFEFRVFGFGFRFGQLLIVRFLRAQNALNTGQGVQLRGRSKVFISPHT